MINQGLLPLKPNTTVQAEHQPDVNLGQNAERQAPNAKAELSPLALGAYFPPCFHCTYIKVNIFLQE